MVKRFVNIHLDCIVSNLKIISKMSRLQWCTQSKIFDSDSTPALAEYTRTPKHFQFLHSDS